MRPSYLLPLAALLAASPLHAAVTEAGSFVKATELADRKSKPLVALVHGSSWHRASQAFIDGFWATRTFRDKLTGTPILTTIHVRQHLGEEEAKAAQEATKGWNPKSVSSFPAIQIYSPGGVLLKTIGGRDLRALATSADELAASVNEILAASAKRESILAEAAPPAKGEASALAEELASLPVNTDPAMLEKLKALDPGDESGWLARLQFKDWDFVREITARLDKGEAPGIIGEIDVMLKNKTFSDEQRSLILCARGMALGKLGRNAEAWDAYTAAYRIDPGGANGKAIIRHGYETVGSKLGTSLPPDLEQVLTGVAGS